MGGGSSYCPSEPLEGPLERTRLGIQFDRVCSHQSPEISRETLAHFASPTDQKGCKVCVHLALPFLLRLELLPSNQGSGITPLNKGTLRSVFPGAWDRKFAGCGKCDPPSCKKRPQAAVCLPASILSKKFTDIMGDLQFCSEQQSSSERAVKCPFPVPSLHRHSWLRAVLPMRNQAAAV